MDAEERRRRDPLSFPALARIYERAPVGQLCSHSMGKTRTHLSSLATISHKTSCLVLSRDPRFMTSSSCVISLQLGPPTDLAPKLIKLELSSSLAFPAPIPALSLLSLLREGAPSPLVEGQRRIDEVATPGIYMLLVLRKAEVLRWPCEEPAPSAVPAVGADCCALILIGEAERKGMLFVGRLLLPSEFP